MRCCLGSPTQRPTCAVGRRPGPSPASLAPPSLPGGRCSRRSRACAAARRRCSRPRRWTGTWLRGAGPWARPRPPARACWGATPPKPRRWGWGRVAGLGEGGRARGGWQGRAAVTPLGSRASAAPARRCAACSPRPGAPVSWAASAPHWAAGVGPGGRRVGAGAERHGGAGRVRARQGRQYAGERGGGATRQRLGTEGPRRMGGPPAHSGAVRACVPTSCARWAVPCCAAPHRRPLPAAARRSWTGCVARCAPSWWAWPRP
jgi:hypothetical protein